MSMTTCNIGDFADTGVEDTGVEVIDPWTIG